MAVIEERKTGDGKTKYRALIRLKGYPPQSATFDRKTDAKNWATQTEAAIREGRHFKTVEAKRHTFGEMIDRYMKYRDSETAHRARQAKGPGELVEGRAGSYTLADVTPAMIAECRDRLLSGKTYRKTNRSPATVVRYLAALSHAYSTAVSEWGWLENNPVRR